MSRGDPMIVGDSWRVMRSRIAGVAALHGRHVPGFVIAANDVTEELLFESDDEPPPAGLSGSPRRRHAVYAFEFTARLGEEAADRHLDPALHDRCDPSHAPGSRGRRAPDRGGSRPHGRW